MNRLDLWPYCGLNMFQQWYFVGSTPSAGTDEHSSSPEKVPFSSKIMDRPFDWFTDLKPSPAAVWQMREVSDLCISRAKVLLSENFNFWDGERKPHLDKLRAEAEKAIADAGGGKFFISFLNAWRVEFGSALTAAGWNLKTMPLFEVNTLGIAFLESSVELHKSGDPLNSRLCRLVAIYLLGLANRDIPEGVALLEITAPLFEPAPAVQPKLGNN